MNFAIIIIIFTFFLGIFSNTQALHQFDSSSNRIGMAADRLA